MWQVYLEIHLMRTIAVVCKITFLTCQKINLCSWKSKNDTAILPGSNKTVVYVLVFSLIFGWRLR